MQQKAESVRANTGIEEIARPRQKTRPQKLIKPEKHIKYHHNHKQALKRGQRPAGQHPVIDLQHVKWAREHQKVDRRTEQPHLHKGAT